MSTRGRAVSVGLRSPGTAPVNSPTAAACTIERYDTDGQLQERRTYGLGLDEVVSLELKVGGTLEEYVPIYGSSGHLAMVVPASTGVPVEAYEYSPYGQRSVYVNDLSGPAIEQVRVRPDAIWLELSEEVRLEDLADAVTLENLTLGGQELPVEISQPVLEGRNAGRRVAVWADLPDTAPDGQPTWPPRSGEQIRLRVGAAGLSDVWGNVGPAGEERTWQWAGGDVVLADTAAPRVLRVCVTVDGRIEIELSEQVDAATLGAISVDGQAVGWTVSSTGYVLTSAPLAAGSRALVIGTALEDLVGTALGEQWSGSVDVVEGEPSLAWAAPWPGAVGESSVGNQLGFHGLPHDPVTGLVYARNRDYDPEMGRFVQTDPLGYVDSVSLYQYGLNNPVNFSDPTGEFVPVAVAGAAAVSGGVSVGIGWGVAKLTGQKYDWADAGVDFALGAGTFGLDKWFKGGKIGLAGAKLWGARIGAEAALDIGGEVARNWSHGRTASLGELARGAAFNTVLGQAGAALGRGLMGRFGRKAADVVSETGSPPQLTAGRLWEEAELARLGKPKNNDVWRPSPADIESAAFQVIVGRPKYTKGGKLVGTIVDIAETGGSVEIKGGVRMLESSYQLRLQTYRALKLVTPLTIRTTRPVNAVFADWLERWGVTVERVAKGS